MPKDGMPLEGYIADAQVKNIRQLHVMLRDARGQLKHHGRNTFMGREAKKAILAAEEEMENRELPIPEEGEETAAWDRKAQ